jgi:hypothetical protein
LFFAVIGFVAVPVFIGFLPSHSEDKQESDTSHLEDGLPFIVVP